MTTAPGSNQTAEDTAPSPAAPIPVAAVDGGDLAMRVEAALLTSDRPMGVTRLAEALGAASVKVVHAAVEQLNAQYEQTGRSFRIEQVAGGYQVLTLPQLGQALEALRRGRQQTRLSPAALETLAIVAYRQPVLRAEIESIRGVACGEVLRSLMERRLVKIAGRAEEIGRPMLYGTTRTFLEVFGLAGLSDLPRVESLTPRPQPSAAQQDLFEQEAAPDPTDAEASTRQDPGEGAS
jgi:segregation and condensation protein B